MNKGSSGSVNSYDLGSMFACSSRHFKQLKLESILLLRRLAVGVKCCYGGEIKHFLGLITAPPALKNDFVLV